MKNTEQSVFDRLSADPKADGEWDMLVLAALSGPVAVQGLLDSDSRPEKSAAVPVDISVKKPLGAYLKSISVEGFRGIGESKTLELPPGPGLTLVVGRNGSGKSSFAEALELLVTGDTYRWRKPRSQVWREGWRNLHHMPAAIQAEFHIEGEKGTTVAATSWKDDADLDAAETFAQVHGKPRTELAALGWKQALATYRPFLSYNELGSMLDEGPSKLFDALSAILGLEELTQAADTLAEERKKRERLHKEAGEKRAEILGLLPAMDDDRARTLVAAIEKKDWGLGAVEAALAKAASGSGVDSGEQILRQLAILQAPQPEAVAAVVRELREAEARVTASAGTLAARSKDLAEILDQALRFHKKHGDADCPVCGKPEALDAKWHDHQAKEIEQLRGKAREATEAHRAADEARRKALALPSPQPEALARASEAGLDAYATTMALETWRAGLTASTDLGALAEHIEGTAGKLEAATTALRTAATAELQRREDRWKPVVPPLAAWLEQARKARKGDEAVKPLKAAEKWLKDAAEEIRNERFAPIKQKAQQIWNQLRMQSNVALEDIFLTGSGNRRQVELNVTVDGTKGAALGVMSQGEQNALALSLFIPRATLAESPFRFVVIDDPVQSMDPSRIDGLARVLHETAGKRQVVVFTHDDRLPEALRRLVIPATVIEVTRREGSVVELRQTRDPVARYIEDAMAIAFTDALPPQAARRVVPGLCRLAIEAACTEAVRRRRIGRGEPHAAVEDLLGRLNGTKPLAALALFDDEKRTGDVLPRLDKERRDFADVYRSVNEGSHVEIAGPIVDLVRKAEKLAGWMQTLT